MGLSLEPLCHEKRHDEFIFNHPPTHLKRQLDVLHDKMGLDVIPWTISSWIDKIKFLKNAYFTYLKF